MAAVDLATTLVQAGRALAALLLLACLLAACGPSAEEGEVANAGGQVGAGTSTGAETEGRPNVILILTDDLDAASISHMPNLESLLAEKGTTFENAFVTDPLCCPSRATILRGQYAHNHDILSNEPPHGGFEKFRSLGRQNSTMATWVDGVGYRTIFVGKYMNGYEGTYVPPGWDEWYAVSGNYLSTDLNENGTINHYDPAQDYLTDVLADRAVDYVGRPGGGAPSFFKPHRPFFMWLGTTAPHAPADPAPRHADDLAGVSMPRPPSFDESDVSDKPAWISDNPSLSAEQAARAEGLYRNRLRSMLAVDEMIGRLVRALREGGELDNTYLVFTSDNGFHLGQHRLAAGKWTAYEEDIRVPLIVRGPGVPEGRTLEHLVLNNDLAPTFADLAGAESPSFVDGRSLVPLLSGPPPPQEDWRRAFLVEAMDEIGRCTGIRRRRGAGSAPYGRHAAARGRAALLAAGRGAAPDRGAPRPAGRENPGPPLRRVRERGERALRPRAGPIPARQRLRGRQPRQPLAIRGLARGAARLHRRGLPRRRGRRTLGNSEL